MKNNFTSKNNSHISHSNNTVFTSNNFHRYFKNLTEYVFKTGNVAIDFNMSMMNEEDSKDLIIENGKYVNSIHSFLVKSKKYSKKLLNILTTNDVMNNSEIKNLKENLKNNNNTSVKRIKLDSEYPNNLVKKVIEMFYTEEIKIDSNFIFDLYKLSYELIILDLSQSIIEKIRENLDDISAPFIFDNLIGYKGDNENKLIEICLENFIENDLKNLEEYVKSEHNSNIDPEKHLNSLFDCINQQKSIGKNVNITEDRKLNFILTYFESSNLSDYYEYDSDKRAMIKQIIKRNINFSSNISKSALDRLLNEHPDVYEGLEKVELQMRNLSFKVNKLEDSEKLKEIKLKESLSSGNALSNNPKIIAIENEIVNLKENLNDIRVMVEQMRKDFIYFTSQLTDETYYKFKYMTQILDLQDYKILKNFFLSDFTLNQKLYDFHEEGINLELLNSKIAGKANILFLIKTSSDIKIGSFYSISYPAKLNNNDIKYFQDSQSFMFSLSEAIKFIADESSEKHLSINNKYFISHGNTNGNDGINILSGKIGVIISESSAYKILNNDSSKSKIFSRDPYASEIVNLEVFEVIFKK
jgi:hypothetical protein